MHPIIPVCSRDPQTQHTHAHHNTSHTHYTHTQHTHTPHTHMGKVEFAYSKQLKDFPNDFQCVACVGVCGVCVWVCMCVFICLCVCVCVWCVCVCVCVVCVCFRVELLSSHAVADGCLSINITFHLQCVEILMH